ncbi:MAG TPA: TonB-dependent receptor [Acidocella sp.]|nr:TonB-dependent receptor [Acidocella sp.]
MKRTGLLLGTACGTLIACSSLAFAQDASAPTPIQGISKSAASTAAAARTVKIPLKSTYSASVITKQMIETASPMKTAQDILAREPSIYVTNNGPGGVNQQVTFRAFNSAQFSETYDGIGLNDAFNGSVTAQADNNNNTLLTSNDFDSIQLYRGINNPAVNSYDSLGGTVNYSPRVPTDTAGSEVGAGYGSFNTFNWHATLNTGLYDGVKQIVSFARQTSDGWTQQDKNSGSNLYYGLDAPLNGGNTNIYGSFVYNTSAGDVNQLMPVDQLHQFGDSYQLPTSDYYKQNTSTNFAAIAGITQQFTPYLSGDIKGFVAENDYVRNSFCNRTFANSYNYPVSDCSHRPYHLYGYYTNTFGVQPSTTLDLPYNTVKLGGNLTFSHLHSREFFSATTPVIPNPQPDGSGNDFWNEHDYRTLGSVYVQDEISLLNDKLKITPGVKYLWAITKDTDEASYYYSVTGNVSNTNHYLSPTLGASYEIIPGLVAYAAYGQNVKFPEITSYYGNVGQFNSITNQYVNVPVYTQPEYVKDYEAGLRYEHGAFSVAANYYLEDFTNTFENYTNPSTGLSSTTNGGSSRYDGEEFQVGDDFGAIGGNVIPGNFAGYLNFAHNNAVYTSTFTDPVNGNTINKGDNVGNVPDNLVSAGVNWAWGSYYAAVDTRYIGSQTLYLANSTTPSGSTQGSYFLTDLTLRDTVPVNFGIAKALVFTLNIDNLFGVRYYTQADINQTYSGSNYLEAIVGAPRAFYGSVAMQF